jgi:GntR family transcriptional repressor for pyruvate dehydrogenase complex
MTDRVVGPVEFQLTAIDKPRVYDSIVDQLLEGIRSGAFPPGSVLPAERELAARFGVSRGSVREAIRVLEHSGVVDVRTGSGTYIAEAGLSQATALRAHAALLGE